MIAADLDELHGDNQLDKATGARRAGALVNGRGDSRTGTTS